MRAIDGDRLKRKAQKVATEAWKMKTKATVEVILNEFIDWINDAPTIEPERKKGKWVSCTDERFVMCSVCSMETTRNELAGIALFGENEPNFCPNCGADMREDGEADENGV